MRHISSLDALRGYCVIAVFVFHAGYVPCGWVGVQAFFVLSGFLITGILVTQKQNNQFGGYLTTFYARRTLRIFPAYYAFLLLLLALWSLGLTPNMMRQFGQSIPYLLSYTENFQSIGVNYVNTHYYSHLWTLSVEEQFYLIWPLVVWFTPLKRLPLVCLGIVVLCTMFRTGITLMSWSDEFRYLAANRFSLTQFDAFAVGAIFRIVPMPDAIKSLKAFLISCAIMLVLGIIMLRAPNPTNGVHFVGLKTLGWSQEFPTAGGFVWGYIALNLFFGQLIAILSDRQQEATNPIFRLFDFKWLRGLGTISYGFYIYHDPMIGAMNDIGEHFGISHLIVSVMALLCTIGAAWTSYVVIEKPFLRLKGLWTYRPLGSNEAYQRT